MDLSPAEYVIHIFGGVRAAARILKKYPATISKWRHYEDKQGRKGQVPTSAQRLIIEKARELDLDLKPEDLIFGRTVNNTEALQ